jgi:hypothetical protein
MSGHRRNNISELAQAWEDAYTLGYADSKAGTPPTRENPYKKEPAMDAKDAEPAHELARTQIEPPVRVWCKCGLQFDAFGDKGAMGKLNDHIFRELIRPTPRPARPSPHTTTRTPHE